MMNVCRLNLLRNIEYIFHTLCTFICAILKTMQSQSLEVWINFRQSLWIINFLAHLSPPGDLLLSVPSSLHCFFMYMFIYFMQHCYVKLELGIYLSLIAHALIRIICDELLRSWIQLSLHNIIIYEY